MEQANWKEFSFGIKVSPDDEALDFLSEKVAEVRRKRAESLDDLMNGRSDRHADDYKDYCPCCGTEI